MDRTASGHCNVPFFEEEVVRFSFVHCLFVFLCSYVFITLPDILLLSSECSFGSFFRFYIIDINHLLEMRISYIFSVMPFNFANDVCDVDILLKFLHNTIYLLSFLCCVFCLGSPPIPNL